MWNIVLDFRLANELTNLELSKSDAIANCSGRNACEVCRAPRKPQGGVDLTDVIRAFLGMEVFFPGVSLPSGTVLFDTGRSKAERCEDLF